MLSQSGLGFEGTRISDQKTEHRNISDYAVGINEHRNDVNEMTP